MDIDPTAGTNAAQKKLGWKFVPLQLCIPIMKHAQTD